jgi:hypothetical protein
VPKARRVSAALVRGFIERMSAARPATSADAADVPQNVAYASFRHVAVLQPGAERSTQLPRFDHAYRRAARPVAATATTFAAAAG